MDEELTWSSSKDDVFNAIKDYPMAGIFEDTVDELVETAPYNILKAWIQYDNNHLTSSSCHPKIFVKEFGDFLMPCHQHCLGINLLVQR